MSTGYVEMSHAWKKFRYGVVHARLRDAIPALVGRLWRGRRAAGARADEFWALRDVSFVVRPGEALGLIGHNGAGKSTILNLLTRIMRPTAGTCTVHGRTGALIEVAAGFHPDLTGRENLYLQGVIMGMPRREVARKFEQIVEFADLAAFIDTPVKRYSSGMQARLGFAIAAHLEPDVLLVDEVLAVGDTAFQTRAYGKVTELVRQQRPVVIVSHQLEAVMALCTHALLLERGRVVRHGTPRECIAAYLHGEPGDRSGGPGDGDSAVRIDDLRIRQHPVDSGEQVAVELACIVVKPGWTHTETVLLTVRSAQTGEVVHQTGTAQLNLPLPHEGAFQLTFELQMNVPPGMYVLETVIWNREASWPAAGGPTTYLEVRGEPFVGSTQLSPRARITRPAS